MSDTKARSITGLQATELVDKITKLASNSDIYITKGEFISESGGKQQFYIHLGDDPIQFYGPFHTLGAVAEWRGNKKFSPFSQAEQDLREALGEDVPRSFKNRFQMSGFRNDIERSINFVTLSLHGLAREVGHWTDLDTGKDITKQTLEAMPKMEMVGWVASKLLLTHSEISEGVEGIRCNLMDDKLPTRTMLECELADVVIRVMDLAGLLELDLGGAIAEKSAFNAERPDHTLEERRKTNGKLF